MQLTNSLEWSECKSVLLSKAHKAGFFSDLRKMILGIDKEITKLSNAEVLQRSGRISNIASVLNSVNQRIQEVEESIVYASIMGQRW